MPKIKNILITAIFSLLLCIRTFFGIEVEPLSEKQYNIYKIELKQGLGKVLEINGRINFERTYLHLNRTEDGNYLLTAKLKKKSESRGVSHYEIDSLVEKERIQESGLKLYFKRKVDLLLVNNSINFKNFYRGVILGDSSYIHRDVREKFNYAGISHLLAISGLHFGIIISILLFLLKKAPVSKSIRYIIEFLILTLYILGINLSASNIRAYIMGGLIVLAGLLYERTDNKKSFNIAFMVTLLINPLYIREASFQFSYLAVFAILYIYPKFKEQIEEFKINSLSKKCLNMLVLALTIQVFLTPVSVKIFQQLPLFSFTVNLIFIPLGSVVIFVCFLAFILSNVGLGIFLMPLTEILYNLMISILDVIVKVPYLSVKTKIEISNFQCVLAYLFILGVVFLPELWYSLTDKTAYRRKL